MQLAFNVNVQVKDGSLVFTDPAGQTVTFSKEQTVQKKVSMITLGELCGLPKRQLATGFGFKTRKSSSDIRHAVLKGAPADLVPKRTGPHTPIGARISCNSLKRGGILHVQFPSMYRRMDHAAASHRFRYPL